MVEVRTANQLEDLRELLTLSGDVSIAVAYVRESGLREIEEHLLVAREKGPIRFLFSLDGRVTEPTAAERLLGLAGQGFEVKYFEIPASERAIFHPKLYICRTEESTTFLTGSYNLTGAALGRNREHGLRVSCLNSEDPAREALASFDALWENDLARPLTKEKVADYADNYLHTITAPNDALAADQRHWMFKCNPGQHDFYFGTLVQDGMTDWGGEVDHPQSRTNLEREVQVGDRVIIYHTTHSPERRQNIAERAAMGCAHVTRKYANPAGRVIVDLSLNFPFNEPVTLEEIQDGVRHPDLQHLAGLMTNFPQSQHNIQRLTKREFDEIVHLGMGANQP